VISFVLITWIHSVCPLLPGNVFTVALKVIPDVATTLLQVVGRLGIKSSEYQHLLFSRRIAHRNRAAYMPGCCRRYDCGCWSDGFEGRISRQAAIETTCDIGSGKTWDVDAVLIGQRVVALWIEPVCGQIGFVSFV